MYEDDVSSVSPSSFGSDEGLVLETMFTYAIVTSLNQIDFKKKLASVTFYQNK